MSDEPTEQEVGWTFISSRPELLQARSHVINGQEVIEIRCPSGTSVLHREAAIILAKNIIAACLPGTP
jgi:hypothetical protein